ncbi:hypothetical protein CLV49_2432 [Labedella gwakjiensis]|uniref:Uncharacterized protein n=1 Tax=Labedella gwakjiensis TaxID=390269 RepID=A0A2P8GXW0_9MICO|nr:hypothetical protein [Labedella gwakjiensis]PSL38803.1 hypothetical protein CLV49_2432 [Labedella gwakjiensis]
MTLFLVFAALLFLSGIVWTLVDVARDGYRRRPTLERDGRDRPDR